MLDEMAYSKVIRNLPYVWNYEKPCDFFFRFVLLYFIPKNMSTYFFWSFHQA